MSKRNFAKVAMIAAAAATALGVMTPAAAQPSGYYGSGQYESYEACQRARTNRSIIGGLIGAAAGASLGFNAGARGHRNDGAWTGGAVGGIGGALIGNRTARPCDSGAAPPPAPRASSGYYDRGGYDADRSYYGESRYAPAPYDRYGPPRYAAQETTVVVEDPRAAQADNCTLADSPIYLPDGRVQKRFVRVCRDATGRYQVVD